MKKSRSTQHMMKKWFVKLPHIPIGEDTVSFECQNVKIKSEWKKSKVNKIAFTKTEVNNCVLEKLVDTSFAMRRWDILESTSTYFAEYLC